MTSQLTIGGTLTGNPVGSINIGPYSLAANTSGNLQATPITLVSGANTFAIPSWATGVMIVPSASNAVALTLKGVTGDTGFAISPSTPSVISLPSTASSFVITAASLTTTITEIIFF